MLGALDPHVTTTMESFRGDPENIPKIFKVRTGISLDIWLMAWQLTGSTSDILGSKYPSLYNIVPFQGGASFHVLANIPRVYAQAENLPMDCNYLCCHRVCDDNLGHILYLHTL